MDIQTDPTTQRFVLTADGDFKMNSGLDAIIQYCGQALRTFLNEWFLDQTIGLPYYQEIFKKNPNQTTIEAAIKARISSCPGILDLQAFSLTVVSATRQLQVSFKAQSVNGPVTFNESIGV